MNTVDDGDPGGYIKKYENKTLLVKVSGKELNNVTFENIQKLIENKIKIILVYGGGVKIDEHWGKYTSAPRPKHNGVGITSSEVVEKALIPAYTEINNEITHKLGYGVIFSENIECQYKDEPKYGQVGEVKEIHGIDFSKSFNGIGFVGKYKENFLNINADEIVTYIVNNYHEQINAVLFLSDLEGLLDKNKKLVSVILKSDIPAILKGESPYIEVNGGMIKKVEEIATITQKISKVVLTTGANLYGEIESWKGKGTMFIDDDKMMLAPIVSQQDKNIFEVVYDEYVEKGLFKKRNEAQMEEIIHNHRVLTIDNTILGGFSISNVGNKHMLIECMWSGYIRSGLGCVLIKKAMEIAKAQDRSLFLISSSEKTAVMVKKNGFQEIGTVGKCNIVNDENIEIVDYLKTYSPERKNSFVYLQQQ